MSDLHDDLKTDASHDLDESNVVENSQLAVATAGEFGGSRDYYKPPAWYVVAGKAVWSVIVKFALWVYHYICGVGIMLWRAIKSFPFVVWGGMCSIGREARDWGVRLVKGDWKTRMSYLFMGAGHFLRKQFVIGFMYLAFQALYIVYMVFLGVPNLALFGTLGRIEQQIEGGVVTVQGDNSLTILIWSIFAIMFTVALLVMYVKNTKSAYENQLIEQSGGKVNSFKQSLNNALNDKYSTTILLLPVFGIVLITILPLFINIFVAFSDYANSTNASTAPPAHLFHWVDFANFGELFSSSSNLGTTFLDVLGWTLIWAVFATFTNYFAGMILALMINKRSIKLKKLWRTCFMMSIAIPQFISLLIMSKFLADQGALNNLFSQWGITQTLKDWGWINNNFIPFLSQASWGRVMIILVNMWIGIPYTILSTTGILMNIPADLYESAKIDGAGPVKQFMKITLPYMLFVTGPQLLTTFTGNINNFNVIFLLTGGGPLSPSYALSAGQTDLLITWLYKITVTNADQNYSMGAVIGIMIFIVMSFFSLIVFNSSKSVKQEDTFQ